MPAATGNYSTSPAGTFLAPGAGRRSAGRNDRSSAVLAATAAINPLKALIVSAPEDLRSELRGKSSATPIPASSGMTHRHRLNRGGDRQLNRALHTITLIRMRVGPATRAYVAERAFARTIFKLLERTTAASGYR